MNIFIGFDNVASIINDLKVAFTEKGHSVFFATKHKPANITLSGADFILQEEIDKFPLFRPRRISTKLKHKRAEKIKREFFENAIKKFDLFIFLWNTFENDFSDLEILKKHNKKIIFCFVGDDARWHFSANQEFKKYGMPEVKYESYHCYTKDYLQLNLNRIRSAERYADAVFSRLDQSQLELRPYYRWNMMVNAKDYLVNDKQNKTPLILHAPSSFVIKGSSVIIETINRLRKEGYDFEFKLLENMPHIQFKALLSSADILIDQLVLPGTGKVSTEGLSYGKVVLSHMAYDKFPQKNPKECPIVDVNPDTLYEKLKELIVNFELRQSVAKLGRAYVEKYLDVRHFCNRVLELVEGKSPEFDYEPDFFRNEFIPENDEYAKLYNESIDKVKDCDWYRAGIKPGQREGLLF